MLGRVGASRTAPGRMEVRSGGYGVRFQLVSRSATTRRNSTPFRTNVGFDRPWSWNASTTSKATGASQRSSPVSRSNYGPSRRSRLDSTDGRLAPTLASEQTYRVLRRGAIETQTCVRLWVRKRQGRRFHAQQPANRRFAAGPAGDRGYRAIGPGDDRVCAPPRMVLRSAQRPECGRGHDPQRHGVPVSGRPGSCRMPMARPTSACEGYP
jgi:hypothetical protein